MRKFIGKSNERIWCKLSKSEILRLYSIVHVAMETTKTSHFTCRSKSFIGIFFTCQLSACELQPFSCHDLTNDIYSQTAKTVFNHLKKWICAASELIPSRLIRQMLANFLELNSKGLHQSSGKEKESCCLLFPSSTKREIRQFHVVVVQRRQRNVQKSVFCLSKSIAFLLYSLPSPSWLRKLTNIHT